METGILDLLLTNGRIHTMVKEGDVAEAVGIRGGRIAFVGSGAEATGLQARKRVDLAGAAVLPGLGDSHMHLYAYCQNRTTVDLSTAKSLEEGMRLMGDKAKVTRPDAWVKGTGFDHTRWPENRLPNRHDLDRAVPDRPAVIRRSCLHVVVANSKAIELAGVTDETARGSGGTVGMGADGRPDGIFRERSTAFFDSIVPDPLSDRNERKRIMREVFGDMVSRGMTVIHTYAAKIWNYIEDIDIYRELEEEGSLPLRVFVCLDELFSPEAVGGEREDPFRKVRYGSYKIFTDGSFGSRSAALSRPYTDDPDNYGILVNDAESLAGEVEKACAAGLQPAIHAIGDRALEITLLAIEDAAERWKPTLPFRIIHAQYVTMEHLERLKRLPVVLDVQPVFLSTDLHWIRDRLGPERTRDTYVWKRMLEAGLVLAGSSDCPVESYDPMVGIQAAVTRQDPTGYPPGGFAPEERLSVYEAISLFTKNIPFATGDQERAGTIETGKFADLAILEQDPFLVPPAELSHVRAICTLVAGRPVYDRVGFFV